MDDLGIINFNETKDYTLHQLEDMCSDQAYIDIWERTVITEEYLNLENIEKAFIEGLQSVIDQIVHSYNALPSYEESSDFVAMGLLFIFDESQMVYRKSTHTMRLDEIKRSGNDFNNFLHVGLNNTKDLFRTIHEFLSVALNKFFTDHTFVISHCKVSDGIIVDIFTGKSTSQVDFLRFLVFDYLNKSAGSNPK